MQVRTLKLSQRKGGLLRLVLRRRLRISLGLGQIVVLVEELPARLAL